MDRQVDEEFILVDRVFNSMIQDKMLRSDYHFWFMRSAFNKRSKELDQRQISEMPEPGRTQSIGPAGACTLISE